MYEVAEYQRKIFNFLRGVHSPEPKRWQVTYGVYR